MEGGHEGKCDEKSGGCSHVWPPLCTSVTGLMALGKSLPFPGLGFSKLKNEEVGLHWQFSNWFSLIIETFVFFQKNSHVEL